MTVIPGDELINKMLLLHLKDHINKDNIYTEHLFDGEGYSICLRNYLLWNYFGFSITDNLETFYLNKYYWFLKFYFKYKLIKGEDAGIEQQISQLIEEIFNKIPNMDWKHLENINIEIENETK